MFISHFLIPFIQVVLVVNAVYTPTRNIKARHAAILHARAPVPNPIPLPVNSIKKRDSKKCRARPSSTSLPSSSPSVAPINPAPAPVSSSSPTHKQVTTHQPESTFSEQPPHTIQKPSPTTSSQHHAPSSNPPSGGDTGSNPLGGFFAGLQTGAQLTYYSLGLTACGQTYSDTDLVAAVSEHLFDNVPGAGANPNNNPICGKKITVFYGDSSVDVTIVDRCVACAVKDIDLSPKAFSALADQSKGRLFGGSWKFI